LTTIVALRPAAAPGSAVISLERTSANVSGDWGVMDVDLSNCQAPPWDAPEAVKLRGAALRHLLELEPSVASAIQALLGQQERHPIYVRTLSPLSEALDWETLYDVNSETFLALQDQWPIGRTTKGSSADRQPQSLPQPFRVLAVMSAAGPGQSAIPEFRALRSAIQAVRDAGFAVELDVITGEPALLAEAEKAGETASLLPAKATLLAQEIRKKDPRPHVLHLYGHGGEAAGVPFIELATKADFAANKPKGSIVLKADALAGAIRNTGLWLVVLSSCSGAAGTAESRSLARRVVEDARIPAAIGMAAPVAPATAATFTGALYTTLLEVVQEMVAEPSNAELDWASLLLASRVELCGVNDPRATRDWALPVVYALDPPFAPTFEEGELSAKQRTKLDAVAEFLRSLPEGDDALREKIRATLAPIPEQFWPDLEGRFAGG
jgi:hypothetical protein